MFCEAVPPWVAWQSSWVEVGRGLLEPQGARQAARSPGPLQTDGDLPGPALMTSEQCPGCGK